MENTFTIESVDGVMPDEINGHAGFRFFITLDDVVHSVGEGRSVHVFAQKAGRWKAGDTVELLEQPNESFNLNGPGEEDVPDGEGTYCYAKIKRPEGQQGGGGFKRQSKGFSRPAQAPPAQAKKGFARPSSSAQGAPVTTQPTQGATQVATPAIPVKKYSLEEADVVYDRLLGESLRACAHTTEDFYGNENPEFNAKCAATMASARANAIFMAWTQGRIDVTPKRNPIRELVEGVDKDTTGDDDGMD